MSASPAKGAPMTKRSEFTTLTKLKAMARYARCPGVFELGIKCGKE